MIFDENPTLSLLITASPPYPLLVSLTRIVLGAPHTGLPTQFQGKWGIRNQMFRIIRLVVSDPTWHCKGVALFFSKYMQLF